MKSSLELQSSVCWKHSSLSSNETCCHTVPCNRISKSPHRTSTIGPTATKLPHSISRHVRSGTLHLLLLITLLVSIFFNVSEGIAVPRNTFHQSITDVSTAAIKETVRERRAFIDFEANPGSLWPNSTVPYIIDKGLPLRIQRQIQKAMCVWMKQTNCVRFVKRTNEKYFIRFVYNTLPVCNSFIGVLPAAIFYPPNKKPLGQPVLLATNCNRGHILHELGHVLGFYHEHQRVDRDQYITVNYSNIWPDPKVYENFAIITDAVSLGTPYDYGSIMHYALDAHSFNGEPTLIPLRAYSGMIGQRKQLSELDRFKVNTIYQCSDIGANSKMLPPKADIITNGNWITLSPMGYNDAYKHRLECNHYNCTLSDCAGRLFKPHDVKDCPNNLISIEKFPKDPNDTIIRSGDNVSLYWEEPPTDNPLFAPLFCSHNKNCSISNAKRCNQSDGFCSARLFTVRVQGKSHGDEVMHNDKLSFQQIHEGAQSSDTNSSIPVFGLACNNVTLLCSSQFQCHSSYNSSIVNYCPGLEFWFVLRKY